MQHLLSHVSLHGIKDDNSRIKPVSVKKQSIWYTELDGANIRKKETMSTSLSSLMIPNTCTEGEN